MITYRSLLTCYCYLSVIVRIDMQEPVDHAESADVSNGCHQNQISSAECNLTNDQQQLLKHLNLEFGASIASADAVEVSFRAPFVKLPRHDARGEAVDLIQQTLSQKGIPLWAAVDIGMRVVSEFADELQTGLVESEFADDVYTVMDAGPWCKLVHDCLRKYCEQIVAVKPTAWDACLYSICSIKNGRRKMEDRHTFLPMLTADVPDVAFYAVYDGHGGVECANYMAAQMPIELTRRLHAADTTIHDHSLLSCSLEATDRRLNARCKHENIRSGTTVVCAMLNRQQNLLHVAWCGDSAAAVLRAESVATLTSEHKPDDPAEKQRVESVGGVVMCVQGEMRVNGLLNISRAFGDVANKPVISSQSDFCTMELDEGEFLLMLACDGVWDALDESEVFEAVRLFTQQHSVDDYPKLAEFLVSKAKSTGASDNMTLIIVFLRSPQDLWTLFEDF